MSSFVPGLATRNAAAIGAALRHAFAPPAGFAVREVGARSMPPPITPKHFTPSEPGHKSTEGWDPFDATAEPVRPELGPTDFVEPVAAARAAGYAEGLAAGRSDAEAASAEHAALLQQVSKALAKGAHFDRERMAGHLRQTVLHLVTRMIGDVGIAPDVLTARIAAATDLLADSNGSAILRLHPDDMSMVEGLLPTTIFPIADPNVARGGYVIESASTVVEDGPDLWLEQLAEAIDRIPIPPTI